MEVSPERYLSGWNLREPVELARGHCSVVWSVLDAGGTERVLKVPFRGEETDTGAHAAVAHASLGGVLVLRADPQTGALLMPRLVPGTSLMSAPESEMREVTLDLMHRLHRAELRTDLTLWDWFAATLEREGSEPLVTDACRLIREMIESAGSVLLHGDLHPGNVLRDGERWVAIDPKGIVGDPAFEPGAFLRNPVDRLPVTDEELIALEQERIAFFATGLGVPERRVWAWGLAETIECAVGDDPHFTTPWGRVLLALEQIGRANGWF